MQGKARTEFRIIDWPRPIKENVAAVLKQQYADILADGEHPSPYLEGLFDGACALLRAISPDFAERAIAEIDDRREP